MGQNNHVVVDGLGDETESVGFKCLRLCEAASDIAITLNSSSVPEGKGPE
jgi:hypothetical protein